jgi:DNA polymerase-3 subunit delta
VSSSLQFFTGENAFALREEKRIWRDEFRKRHGPENLLSLPSQRLTYRALLDEVSAAPFIAQKRLCIVEGVPSFTKEEVEALPAAMHPDCVLLIVDPKPDKRLAAVKALRAVATVKEFPVLAGAPLIRWLTQYVSSLGRTLTADAREALLRIAGEDQEVLSQEIDKLALYAPPGEILREHVEAIVVPSGEQEVWQLTRYLSDGSGTAALRYASGLLERGEDPYSLWNVLLWMLRTLVPVVAAVREGEREPAKIASLFKVPFPSVRGLLPLANRMHLSTLKEFVSWAADADIALKTGGYRFTKDAPQELLALIDRFILHATDLTVARV